MASKKTGWAILGCGRVADRRVAPVFARMESARLVAACSRSRVHARHFAERHNAPRDYDSLDALLADPDVDVVYIATPNANHAEHTLKCLAAGKHVLVDKPMATRSTDAEAMIHAARKAGRLLSVLHQQRFHPANMHMIRLVDDGTLGPLVMVRGQIGMWYPPSDNWRLTKSTAGGGAAMDLGPHALDLLMELGGPVKQVSSTVRNMQHQYEVEDFVCARLDFASGVIGLCDMAYCYHDYGGRMEVFGSKGSFASRGAMQQAALYQSWLRRGETVEPMQEDSYADCFLAAIEDFNDAVRSGEEPSISAIDGLRVLKVIEAIYESGRQGRPVAVEPMKV